jgi:hypothetical protein
LNFVIEPKYKLIDRIVPYADKLKWKKLSSNVNAIDYILDCMETRLSIYSKNNNGVDFADRVDFVSLSINHGLTLEKIRLPKLQKLLNFEYLCFNPNAIEIIEERLYNDQEINWYAISRNINAIHILQKHPDKIDWGSICANINAMPIIENNIDLIDWSRLSCNINAVSFLEKHVDMIVWDSLCMNPNAIHMIRDKIEKGEIDKINWEYLSMNPNAIDLLDKNIDLVDWRNLSTNSNAHILIDKYWDISVNNVDWDLFSSNPSIVKLFDKHWDEIKEMISFEYISYNPDIFYYDKDVVDKFANELCVTKR